MDAKQLKENIKTVLQNSLPEFLATQKRNIILERGDYNDDRNWAPLAERTIKKKGFDDPLIDTGHMYDSIEGKSETSDDDTLLFYVDEGALPEYTKDVDQGNTEKKIPPRPFLNYTEADMAQIRAEVFRLLKNALGG